MKPAISPRESVVKIDTSIGPIGTAPSGSREPHFVVPPTGPGGQTTVGFSFAIFGPISPSSGPPVVSTPGGYVCTFHRLLPSTARWASWAEITLATAEEFLTYDIGGGAAFFVQIAGVTSHGILLFAITPLI